MILFYWRNTLKKKENEHSSYPGLESVELSEASTLVFVTNDSTENSVS